jgi:hypothetical protein
MLLSQYNKNATLMNTCAVAWVFHMFSHLNFQLTSFAIVSFAAFLITTFCVRKIKNSYLNLCGATSSVLLYSICVDVVCYYIYPEFVAGQNLLNYIWNGVLFNAEHLFLNIPVAFFLVILEKLTLVQKFSSSLLVSCK